MKPTIGQRVEFVRGDHERVPPGRRGTIDVVKGDDFWVATDCGGFYDWTNFSSWKPVSS